MLTEKKKCTGCGACVLACPYQCLHLSPDQYGFLHPKISGGCVNCGICDQVCPVQKEIKLSHTTAFAAYAADDSIRMRSSSGGIFPIIAERIVEKHGSIYGAVYKNDFSVHHECNNNVTQYSGAKYVQSILDNSFSKIKKELEMGKTVLFTGTPCQVAGLKCFLRKDYINLICIDFVCHGVPSPLAWKAYLEYRRNRDAGTWVITDINMRSKSSGWSRYSYSVKFMYSDGACYEKQNNEDIYMRLFVNDYINRESCACCSFKGRNRYSDITLGDFWGIWDYYPEMDDNKGTSSIIVNTKKGEKLIQKCRKKMVIKRVAMENIIKGNPSYNTSSKMHPLREVALKYALMGDFDYLEKLLFSTDPISRIHRKILKSRAKLTVKSPKDDDAKSACSDSYVKQKEC